MSSRFKIILLLCLVVSFFFLDVFWGRPSGLVLTEFRLPRVISVLLAGGGLAICGLLLQTLFRNPIVGPNILGISNGAGLGIAIAIMGGTFLGFQASNFYFVLFGCLGSALVTLFLLYFSYRSQNVSALLILGIILSSLTMAVVTFLQFFSPIIDLKRFIFWSMGSVHGITKEGLLPFVGIVLLALSSLPFVWKKLDISLLGQEEASMLGVSFLSLKNIILVVVALITGVVTVYMGNIAFIGLISPHIVRNWFHIYSHKWLLPASFLLGAVLLLACDVVSSYCFSTLMPINIFTSLIASPIIIRYLFKKGFV